MFRGRSREGLEQRANQVGVLGFEWVLLRPRCFLAFLLASLFGTGPEERAYLTCVVYFEGSLAGRVKVATIS